MKLTDLLSLLVKTVQELTDKLKKDENLPLLIRNFNSLTFEVQVQSKRNLKQIQK